jgi:hypothetical protein
MDSVDQQALTGAVILQHGLDPGRLWLDHLALGGDASEQDIRDYCAGRAELPPRDRDTLAQAVNERCADAGLPARAPLSSSPLVQAQSDLGGPHTST